MPMYGQVVVGPPGAGKTTYCDGMQQYLRLVGRDALVVNLDPANEVVAPAGGSEGEGEGEGGGGDDPPTALPYDAILDVCEEIVNLSSVMEELELGPNGGLIYCMEYIEHHLGDVVGILRSRLADHPSAYLLIDLPGQVELYTHCVCVQSILRGLSDALDLRLCMVNLIDASSCADASKFISAALLSTTAMLRLELPAVNVLSKIDMVGRYGRLPYNLDFFTECSDLERLVPFLEGIEEEEEEEEGRGGESADGGDLLEPWYDDPEYVAARTRARTSAFHRRRRRMHEVLSEVVDDYGLLRFVPLDISDAASVGRAVAQVDRANGYVFVADGRARAGGDTGGGAPSGGGVGGGDEVSDLFRCAVQAEAGNGGYEQLADVQEKFMGDTTFRESIAELDRDKRSTTRN